MGEVLGVSPETWDLFATERDAADAAAKTGTCPLPGCDRDSDQPPLPCARCRRQLAGYWRTLPGDGYPFR